MSLFPSEHLSVAITPTAIALCTYKGRWRPRQHDMHEVRFDDGGINNVLGELSHALSSWAKSGASVRFSISNAFVRVGLLPWSAGKLSSGEEAALARQRFIELYGDMNEWQVQLNHKRQYGQPCLAFAMPTHLVEGLLGLSHQYGLECRKITPSAAHSWNRYGEVSQISKLLFSVVESGYGFVLATTGLEEVRIPVTARMLVLKSDSAAVQSALHREILLQGLEDDTQCFCDAFGAAFQDEFETVRTPSARTKASTAMIMAMEGWSF